MTQFMVFDLPFYTAHLNSLKSHILPKWRLSFNLCEIEIKEREKGKIIDNLFWDSTVFYLIWCKKIVRKFTCWGILIYFESDQGCSENHKTIRVWLTSVFVAIFQIRGRRRNWHWNESPISFKFHAKLFHLCLLRHLNFQNS